MWDNLIFFFFKQKTAYEMRISDWSSDVCSSDLVVAGKILAQIAAEFVGEEIISAEDEIAAQTRQRHGIGAGDRAGKIGSRQRNLTLVKAEAERSGCCDLVNPAVYCGAVEPQRQIPERNHRQLELDAFDRLIRRVDAERLVIGEIGSRSIDTGR